MDEEYIIVECPHCKQKILVYKKEFNCKIFRHGVFKKNLKQIDPHLSKSECDRLKNEDLIYGCGKPYKLIIKDGKFYTEICDYI
jgi:hypothetical protein